MSDDVWEEFAYLQNRLKSLSNLMHKHWDEHDKLKLLPGPNTCDVCRVVYKDYADAHGAMDDFQARVERGEV